MTDTRTGEILSLSPQQMRALGNRGIAMLGGPHELRRGTDDAKVRAGIQGERIMNHRFVLITGTSRGIGRATAVRLASVGMSVIAGVRHPEDGARLESAAKGRLTSTILDIGRDESSRRCVTPTCAVPNPS